MNVIERLNENHAEKLRYFLSKADTVPLERDRQKVVVQITQNLSSRIRNKHAFELPSLFIPDKERCSLSPSPQDANALTIGAASAPFRCITLAEASRARSQVNGSGVKIDNILEKTCEEMEQTITRNVQNNLDKLEEDCRVVRDKIDQLLEADAVARKVQTRVHAR